MEVIELDTGKEFRTSGIKYSYFRLVQIPYLFLSLQILVAHFQEP